MPEQRLFPEFRDQFQETPYPFMDNATLLADTGQKIDNDMFLDASLYPIGATDGYVYLSRITVQAREVTLAVADRTRREKATTSFDPLDPPTLLRLTDSYSRPAGVLVSEAVNLTRFSSWEPGEHIFSVAATQFVPSCVIPTPEVGVRGFLTEQGDLLTGDVTIVGDNGVVVRQDPEDASAIRIDIVGEPLFRRQLCTPLEAFATPTFIKSINGCAPDEYGNFNITIGDHLNDTTIIRLYQEDGRLVMEAVGDVT